MALIRKARSYPLSIRLPESLAARIDTIAEAEGQTISDVVRDLLMEALAARDLSVDHAVAAIPFRKR